VKEEDLSINLKLTLRELHKLCAKLREDRLVRMYVSFHYSEYFIYVNNSSSAFSVQKQEARAPDQRAVPKNYYYIDYKQFVNVVKWKMYKMQTSVRDTLRTVSSLTETIRCPVRYIFISMSTIGIWKQRIRLSKLSENLPSSWSCRINQYDWRLVPLWGLR
jgi:hypothetical protein